MHLVELPNFFWNCTTEEAYQFLRRGNGLFDIVSTRRTNTRNYAAPSQFLSHFLRHGAPVHDSQDRSQYPSGQVCIGVNNWVSPVRADVIHFQAKISEEGWIYIGDMMTRHPNHWPTTLTGNFSEVHPTGVRLSPGDLLWVLIWNDKARFGISINKKPEPTTGVLKPYLRLRCVNGHKLDVDPSLLGTQIHLGNPHILEHTGLVIHGTTIVFQDQSTTGLGSTAS